MLFSTIEDFMWFKVALVRPPRTDAGPGSSHGMSMLSQGRVHRIASAKPCSCGPGASVILCPKCAECSGASAWCVKRGVEYACAHAFQLICV